MSKAVVCDNRGCAKTADPDSIGRLDWLIVGWAEGPSFDACSPECAQMVIDARIVPALTDTVSAEDARASVGLDRS